MSERERAREKREKGGGGERERERERERDMPDVEGLQGRELLSNRVPRESPQPHIRCLHKEYTWVNM